MISNRKDDAVVVGDQSIFFYNVVPGLEELDSCAQIVACIVSCQRVIPGPDENNAGIVVLINAVINDPVSCSGEENNAAQVVLIHLIGVYGIVAGGQINAITIILNGIVCNYIIPGHHPDPGHGPIIGTSQLQAFQPGVIGQNANHAKMTAGVQYRPILAHNASQDQAFGYIDAFIIDSRADLNNVPGRGGINCLLNALARVQGNDRCLRGHCQHEDGNKANPEPKGRQLMRS